MTAFRTVPPVHSPVALDSVLRALLRQSTATNASAEIGVRFCQPHVLLTDSGTTALRLAIGIAQEQREGLPLLLPAYGCFDLATAAIGAGVRVRLYDVDPSSLGPDFESLGRAASEGVSAIVVVHQYGVPVDMDIARQLASKFGALLIEDAAQGASGAWRDRPLGSFGDLAVLSFGRGKGVTAGVGGALLSTLPISEVLEPAAPYQHLKLPLILFAQHFLSYAPLYTVPSSLPFLHLGETRFRRPMAMTRMPEFSQRILMSSFELNAKDFGHRRRTALRLCRASVGTRLSPPLLDRVAQPGWLRLPMIPRTPNSGIEPPRRLGVQRGYPTALTRLTELRPLLVGNPRTPGSDLLAASLITLPTHSRLSERDVTALERWMESI